MLMILRGTSWTIARARILDHASLKHARGCEYFLCCRATTHWAWTELLPLVGATHEKGRVVKDGNVITAGGVTSGIDFGLR
ncbi:MAG: hypothetical protein ABW110_07385, partial [Steroidobacteraceae bacterium]